MQIKETLKALSEASGPTGNEEAVAQHILTLLKPLCSEATVDEHYNVIGVKRGEGPEPRPRLMVMAHIDEIYMMVTAVDGAFLRFRPFSYDPRILVGQEVVVLGKERLVGVIGDRPPHLMSAEDRRRMPATKDLVIDLGLDAETLASLVHVGDYVLVARPFMELMGERVAGKAFDNRASVVAMLEALDRLQRLRHPCDILAVASVGEELSGLGARGVMYKLRPDLVLVLDVTFAKQPGAPDRQTFKLGCGPVLGLGPNLHPRLTEKLVEVCEALELDYTFEPTPAHSGTDAWDTQVAAGGAPTGLIGLAIRNMHSPVEMTDLKDISRVARLIAAFAAEVDHAFVENLRFTLPEEVRPA